MKKETKSHIFLFYYYDILSYDYKPSKSQRANSNISDIEDAITSIKYDDESNILLPSEINIIESIIKKGKDRLNKGVIGTNNIIKYNRDTTINNIIK